MFEDAHGIAATVQRVLAQPDNQPHRADLAKMLLHAAQDVARTAGKTLPVLDTTSADAERLYAPSRLG